MFAAVGRSSRRAGWVGPAWPCSAGCAAAWGPPGRPGLAQQWPCCLPFQDPEQLHGAAEDQPGAGGQAVSHGEGCPEAHGPAPSSVALDPSSGGALLSPPAHAGAGSQAFVPGAHCPHPAPTGQGRPHPRRTEWAPSKCERGTGLRPCEPQQPGMSARPGGGQAGLRGRGHALRMVTPAQRRPRDVGPGGPRPELRPCMR